MSETEQPPSTLPWAQFRGQLLTAREARRKAVIESVRRFVEHNPRLARHPRRRAVIEARLQLREELITARFAFRRAVVHSVSQLVSSP
jgi:hypothetical protein